jgi:hypothetical protein
MVLPPFLMFLLGTISAGVAVYTEASLHYAVEGAASYAQTLYKGPGSPTFTASLSSATCGNATNPGHQVNATLNVVLNAGVKENLTPAQWTIPLNATACFP